MPRIKILVLILAGGAGGRLELLTHTRAKPAVPFAGTHRLIDFPLSNCLNSNIDDVWISQQFNPVSLTDHLANGRPWDLDRTSGGLLVLHPRQGNEGGEGFQEGTGEALWSQAELIREFNPSALVVLSADAVYKLDYRMLAEEHCEAGKAVTMVTTEVEPDDADRYGVVQVDGDRVTEYVYKPDGAKGNLVSNEVFVFTPEPVLDALDELVRERGQDDLEDIGHYLLPRLVDAGEARSHRFGDYWRDVGKIDAFHACHMELVGDEPPIDLDDPAWPILTRAIANRASAQVGSSATVQSSLIAPGAKVDGDVSGSVLGRGVVVEKGATVRDSVLMPGAVVRAGATVTRAIIDDHVDVRADVGEAGGEIALVGLHATVDESLPAGARFPQVEDD
ncbi:glucose-1-phosphate adenylyltransferase [Solirubrobacter sp. CPCC 204708]|uniref:Sugar phosphate nucleotidyltransferase n=1 Tax=Solirubrobacter deserti TaxID=2282478 RepID=A0ABT4RE00_9ACTN|nr:sugar phosphate nucleotidyltransferase [Solirubrobacter deserti]MBE2316005.1 glucose-1-phosphate adenylyltransferase [Solirubrobacter deserti]MDA0136757.1 sugar phosphate nucleotidyltransferase [Solirubrobacter deserti]